MLFPALLWSQVYQKRTGNITSWPAAHRYGADLSFDNNTDTYANALRIEAPSFEYNIGGTIFYGKMQGDILDDVLLFPHPLSPGRYVYTSADAAAEIWSDTNDLNQGYNIAAISYRNGTTTYAATNATQEVYLTGRTSSSGDATSADSIPSYYGEDWEGNTLGLIGNSFSNWTFGNSCLTYSSSRWLNSTEDQWGISSATPDAYTLKVKNALLDAIESKGFYRNFTHAHFSGMSIADYEQLLGMVRSVFDSVGVFAFMGGYQAIGDYAAMRQMAIAANNFKVDFRENDIYIRCDIDTTNWPFHLVYEKVLSIPVNISGSALAGQDITCTGCAGIRKIDNDNFVIDLLWSADTERAVSIITGTLSPGYYDFTLPTASVALDGTTATVTCDDCTVIQYSSTSTSEQDINGVLYRAVAFSDTHVFEVSPGTNYFLGVKSRTKQLALIPYNP